MVDWGATVVVAVDEDLKAVRQTARAGAPYLVDGVGRRPCVRRRDCTSALPSARHGLSRQVTLPAPVGSENDPGASGPVHPICVPPLLLHVLLPLHHSFFLSSRHSCPLPAPKDRASRRRRGRGFGETGRGSGTTCSRARAGAGAGPGASAKEIRPDARIRPRGNHVCPRGQIDSLLAKEPPGSYSSGWRSNGYSGTLRDPKVTIATPTIVRVDKSPAFVRKERRSHARLCCFSRLRPAAVARCPVGVQLVPGGAAHVLAGGGGLHGRVDLRQPFGPRPRRTV